MRKILCVFIFFSNFSQGQEAVPYDGMHFPSLFKYYTYYTDSFATITPDKIWNLQKENKLKKWTNGVTFNTGVNSNIYWFYIPIENCTDKHQEAVLRLSTNIDSVSLYAVDSINTIVKLYSTGSYVAIEERPFKYRNIAFPIDLQPSERKNILLRADNRNKGLYIPMYLESVEKVLRNEQKRHWIYGVYFGIFGFIILFNLFLYFSIRDKIHLWYSAYVSSGILFMIQDEDFYTELYPSNWLYFFENASITPFSLLMIGCGLRVMQLFVNQGRDSKVWYLSINILIIICFVISATTFLLSFFNPLFVLPYLKRLYDIDDIITLLSFVFLIGALIEKIIKKQPLAVYYFIAVLLLIFGAFNYFFNHLGITNSNYLQPNGVVVGLTTELIFVSFLLTIRYNTLKRKNEELVKQKVELQIGSANKIIETQEYERKRIARDIHDDLGSTLSSLRFFVANYFNKNTSSTEQEGSYRKNVIDLLNKASNDIRTISHDLMPHDFETMGLKKVLESHITQIGECSPIKFHLVFDGKDYLLTKKIQISIYRMINELIHNIIKHAQATEAIIQCLEYPEYFEVQVSDNGKGFKQNDAHAGIGLNDVQSRVELLNGKVVIDSNNQGTIVIFTIPHLK